MSIINEKKIIEKKIIKEIVVNFIDKENISLEANEVT